MRGFGFGLRLPAFLALQFLPERRSVHMEPLNSGSGYDGITADAAWRCREETHPLIDWGRTKKGEDCLFLKMRRKRMNPPGAFSGAVT